MLALADRSGAVSILQLIRQQAEQRPDGLAFVVTDTNEKLTYAELWERVEVAARWLKERGCRTHERCGLLCPEGLEFPVYALAVLSAGLCVAPVGLFVPQSEVDFVIHAAQLHWLLSPQRRLIRIPFAGSVDLANDEVFRSTNPAYIRLTSGTTGNRKGVLLGHPTIVDRLAAADEVLKIRPADRIWFRLPMADHFVVSVLLYLSRGATLILTQEDSPAAIRGVMSNFHPTVIYGSPQSYCALIEEEVGELESVRLAISTTTSLSEKLQKLFRARFGRPLNPALGIIEVGLLTLNTRSDKVNSVGPAMPAYEVTLVGAEGSPVSPGEIGELYVQGHGLLDAYLNPWRRRQEILTKYGYPTGDMAYLDQEQYLVLAGRNKNRVEVDGLSFFCEEVESVIDAIPGVTESRVFLDTETRSLAAELVADETVISGLAERLSDRLDPRKVPYTFKRVPSLPRTPNGKLLRR
jgi:acyl-coenzyme A synthetase/AMP-(fatty) acid ligase